MSDWIVGAVMLLALGGLIWMIISGRLRRDGGGGFAALTAFHDFQAKDKQQAVEVIIEEKAGKKREEDSTGERKDHESQ